MRRRLAVEASLSFVKLTRLEQRLFTSGVMRVSFNHRKLVRAPATPRKQGKLSVVAAAYPPFFVFCFQKTLPHTQPDKCRYGPGVASPRKNRSTNRCNPVFQIRRLSSQMEVS